MAQTAAASALTPSTSATQQAMATAAAEKDVAAKGLESWRSVRILRNLLWKHMVDQRYFSNPNYQQRLASVSFTSNEAPSFKSCLASARLSAFVFLALILIK